MNGLELFERMQALAKLAERRHSKKWLAHLWVQELVMGRLLYKEPEEALEEARKAVEERTQ